MADSELIVKKINGEGYSPHSLRNHLINGNFDIWQRGVTQTVTGYGSDDRWYNTNTGSTKTHSQVACTDLERALFNSIYFSRTAVVSVLGAANFVQKGQHLEDVTKLAGKTVTISFWAKADTNKNIVLHLAQGFGTGGSPSANVTGIGIQAVALTTTWQKKTVTIAIPSIVGKTLGTDGVNTSSTAITFTFDAGTNLTASNALIGQQSGTFDIAQVQLEEGTVATPFEQRHIGNELALCQRYYLNKPSQYMSQLQSGSAVTDIPFPVQMRVIPTVSSNAGGFTAVNLQKDGLSCYVTSNNAYTFTASAEL